MIEIITIDLQNSMITEYSLVKIPCGNIIYKPILIWPCIIVNLNILWKLNNKICYNFSFIMVHILCECVEYFYSFVKFTNFFSKIM